MTRREYELLAEALRSAAPGEPDPETSDWTEHNGREAQWVADCEAIADALARGTAPGRNLSFDRERFLRDAGVSVP